MSPIRAERICPWARSGGDALGSPRCGLDGGNEPGRVTLAIQVPVRLTDVQRAVFRLYALEAYTVAGGHPVEAARLLGVQSSSLMHRVARDSELREEIAKRWPPWP